MFGRSAPLQWAAYVPLAIVASIALCEVVVLPGAGFRKVTPAPEVTSEPGSGPAFTLFDPLNPAAPPESKLPVALSTEEARELIARVNHLESSYKAYSEESNKRRQKLAWARNYDIREALWSRLTDGKLADTRTPKWWHSLCEESPGDFAAMLADGTLGLIDSQLAATKYRLLGNSVTAGDLRFITWLQERVDERHAELRRTEPVIEGTLQALEREGIERPPYTR